MAGDESIITRAIMGLIQGRSEADLLVGIVSAGTPRDDAGLVLQEARKRVQLAADWNRDEQLGLAIRRLNLILKLALPDPDDPFKAEEVDLAIAIRAQVELNKLLRLHEVPRGDAGDPDEGGSDRADEISRARAHLADLFDVPDDYPLSEIARMAAEKLRACDGNDPAG